MNVFAPAASGNVAMQYGKKSLIFRDLCRCLYIQLLCLFWLFMLSLQLANATEDIIYVAKNGTKITGMEYIHIHHSEETSPIETPTEPSIAPTTPVNETNLQHQQLLYIADEASISGLEYIFVQEEATAPPTVSHAVPKKTKQQAEQQPQQEPVATHHETVKVQSIPFDNSQGALVFGSANILAVVVPASTHAGKILCTKTHDYNYHSSIRTAMAVGAIASIASPTARGYVFQYGNLPPPLFN